MSAIDAELAEKVENAAALIDEAQERWRVTSEDFVSNLSSLIRRADEVAGRLERAARDAENAAMRIEQASRR